MNDTAEDNYPVRNQEDEYGAGQIAVSASFSGPIPAPGILEKYDQVQPGAADRIIAMAEKEQNHRHGMESKIIDAQITEMKLSKSQNRFGQICGLTIGMTAILSGSCVCVLVSPFYGAAIATTGVVSLVSVFVVGKTLGRNKEEEEAQMMPSEEEEDFLLPDT